MWNYSSTDDKWLKKVEKLDKRIFNYLRQEIESVRFYSKCLDGTSYVASQDLDNIYDVLGYKNNDSYKLDSSYSSYFSGTYSVDGTPIETGSLSDIGLFYRYNKEYGFTLKNLFTPTRLINDSTNYLNVDVATTESLNFNNIDVNTSLIIDGITLKDTHRVLVKDNVTTVTLDSSVDPDTYFTSNYYFIKEEGSTKDYYYYNNTNGIYKYTNGDLVKEDDLDVYQDNIRYSVSVKLGDNNISKQFHLSRLLVGVYPLTSNSEPIEFTEKENFIIRNSIEYRNTLDNQFYSGLVQQPTTLDINSQIYQIPNRFLTVGDFGFIVNYQDGHVNILKNKYKEDLRDITELNDKYLIIGKNGTLLSMDKISLIPTLIELDTFQNLNSIDFIDDDKGVIVGEDGTIILTRNQYDWEFIESDIKNDLNKATFIDLSTAVIVGDNGIVERLKLKSNNNNELISEELVIKSDIYDSKKVVNDFVDIDYLEVDNQRFKFVGNDWVDISKNIGNSNFSLDFRFKPTQLNGDSTIFSFLTSKFPVTSGTTIDKGIKISLEEDSSNNFRIKMCVNTENDLLDFIVIDGDINVLENVWYHVFISRDKGEYKLFVNQKFVDSTEDGFKGSFDNFNDRIRLGAELTYTDNGTYSTNTYSSTSYNNFVGTIDQVRLFDKKLDDTEIEIFSNNYQTDLSGMVSWYKFNVYKPEDVKTIRTKDIISGSEVILPNLSNVSGFNTNGSLSFIDTESFKGIIVSGDNIISIVLDIPEGYSNQSLNNQLFIQTETNNIKSITYNPTDKYFYGVSDSVFRIDTEKFEFDLFNQINVLNNIPEELLLNDVYTNLSIDRVDQTLYLIGGENNQTETLDISTICSISENDPLENCGVYVTVSSIINSNGYTIENDYRNDVTDNINISSVNYIKTLGYPGSTQSLLQIPIGLSGSPLNPYEEVYVSLTVDELINGYFEISFNNNDYKQLDHNGDYLIPMSVGSDSSLSIRAVLSDNPNGNKIKGIIKDILIYEADCVQLESSVYDGGTNIKKLYFSQFDTQEQLNKLGTSSTSALYSYIDVKSLKIDDVEQILIGTYSSNFPKYLYKSDFSSESLVNCDAGNLCDFNPSLSNDSIDRIQYGLGIQVDLTGNDYEYIGDSYGLLESFTINSNQIFGMDNSEISNGTSDVNNPYNLGIDFTKSFRFEVDSMIIDSDDLLNSDITNGATTSQYVILDATTVSYGTLSGDYFNQISFTASSSLTHSVIDLSLNENQLYYLEFQLDGDIQIDFGTQSFTYSATGSIIKDSIRMDMDYTSFEISNSSTESDIFNLVLTERIPTKSIIEWNPDICNLSYRLNGSEQEDLGFLQSDGGGEYTPSCSIINSCNNSTLSIIDEGYWDKFKSKLLFLDYDIASKLYFFDTQTDEYQLPNSVDISNISTLSLVSIDGQKSWIDYSKDSTKEFQYLSVKNDSNIVSYSSTFTNVVSSTYSVILNGNSTNDLSDINGATQGLLPNFDSGTISIGTPNVSKDFYFYDKYIIIKQPLDFSVELGDIINMDNSLVSSNMMVIYKFNDGSDTYIYLISNFNQSMTNRLKGWVKSTLITNLNQFEEQSDLISNFNNHPIGVGYNLIDNDDGTITLDSQYNPKTAYYNLQCNVRVTDNLLDIDSQNMEYINKVLSFGYSATYNILDYLSKNPEFTSDYVIGSLPQYTLNNNNSGVIYTVSNGQISFNSSLKNEWESIPNYTFIDMTFGSNVMESILIIGKDYDEESDRYIIQTYNYYGHIYDQSDLNNSSWTLRVRNTLGEISNDLQKFNNIQRSESNNYDITDLSNNVYTTFTSLKSELNFKPNTDSYAKSLLSQKEIKEYLSGLLYTDYKNELSINMVNLSEEKNLVITSINKYNINCDDCDYESYVGFENPSNNIVFNQVSLLDSDTYYTNRVPLSSYGFNNQILILSASGSVTTDFPITFGTGSLSATKTLEFKIEELVDATVEIVKDSSVILTIGSQPNEFTKVQFTDNGVDDLIIRVNYTDGSNTVKINDIRVGEELCIDNCYLTELKVNNHGLEVGDGLIVDITDDIFNLDNQYDSSFDTATTSGWEQNISGSTSSVPLTNGIIEINISSTMSTYFPTSFNVNVGEMYRLSFDYELTHILGTPSVSPSFGTMSSNLNTTLGELTSNGYMEHVEMNFIPTSTDIFIGFNLVDDGEFKLNNISLDKLTNVGQYYDGYQVVTEVIDGDTFVIESDFNGKIEELSATYSYVNKCGLTKIGTSIITNLGEITQFIFDPYLNYAPIDLFELGNDDKLKQSIEIKPNNWVENNDETISLVDMDMTNYRFRLIDGLSLVSLNDDYQWILESEIRNALIGKDENGLVWYSGIWDCGRWFNGTWYSGTWRDGVWYDGTWNNSVVEDLKIKANVSVTDSNTVQSTWYNGDFINGTWNNGEWRNGNHYDGTWNNGTWNNGTWHNGTWNNGSLRRGVWIDGTWELGTFSCGLGLSSWLNGVWNGGDFACGHWYNGRFDSKNSISRFGIKSTSSRNSVWENGNFINGEFHSGDNTNHSYSKWKLGYWNNGTWDGGTAHQINWNNGIWNNGVVKDIKVVAFYGNSNGTYFFTLEGDWHFKIGDTIWIIDNGEYSDVYGSDITPGKYKVDQDFITVNDGEYTKVVVAKVPLSLSSVINPLYVDGYEDNNNPSDNTIDPTQITSIVSYISKVDWYNGQLQNGIFDGNFFRDGIWEKGSFKSGDFGY